MFTKMFKLVFYFEKFQFYNLARHIFLSINRSRKFVSNSMKFLIPCHSFIKSWKDRQGTFTISIQQFFNVSSFKVYSNTLKFIQQGNNKIVTLSLPSYPPENCYPVFRKVGFTLYINISFKLIFYQVVITTFELKPFSFLIILSRFTLVQENIFVMYVSVYFQNNNFVGRGDYLSHYLNHAYIRRVVVLLSGLVLT